MQIETECPGCARKLRVSAEHAGQQARCPVCSTIYSVPSQGESEPAPEEPAVGGVWTMRTPEGQLYGPVDKTELDRWVAEGRVTADCELSPDAGVWQSAEAVFSVLQNSPSAPETTAAPQSRYRYTAHHRGVTVLVLGILGWAGFCPLFGAAAWVTGSSDLREMRAGRMDPSGRGLTQAGMILGMVETLIAVGGIMVFLFVGLARFAMR